MIGSAFAYGFSRLVGRHIIERILGTKRLLRVDQALQTRGGKSVLFMLFLTPGMPKDSICYAVGLTEFRLLEFLVLSPALLFSTLIGSQLYEQSYFFLVLTVVFVGAVVAGIVFYRRNRQGR